MKPLYRIEHLVRDKWQIYTVFHGMQSSYARGAFAMLCSLRGGDQSYRLVAYDPFGTSAAVLAEHGTGNVRAN